MRIVVASCKGREPILDIWMVCKTAFWGDCIYPVDIIPLDEDRGWCANLIQYLDMVEDDFVLLMLDDHFVDPIQDGKISENIATAISIMESMPDIGMIKVQAGNAACPDLPFAPWDRLKEYDRRHHPFKRTNLVPTLFKRSWLRRLSQAILDSQGTEQDQGRNGAINFEVRGTLLTKNEIDWPERMLGIDRPNPDGGGGRSLLACISNDGVREGKLQLQPDSINLIKRVGLDINQIPGIERFL